MPAPWRLPPPNTLGLPYPSWRPDQERVICLALDTPHRFVGIQAPTGCGKSAIAAALLALAGPPGVVLTATKGLQDQYGALFSLTDVRGAGNYECLAARDQFRLEFIGRAAVGCDEGPCRVGEDCERRKDGCLYYDAVRRAQLGEAIVTSYAYWIAFHRYGEGLGQKALLVLDEAHDAAEQLADQLTIELSRYDVGASFPDRATHEAWRAWACALLPEALLRSQTGRVRGRLRYKRLAEQLGQIASLPEDWVWELAGPKARFAPVVVAPFVEAALFRSIPKIVFLSATVTKQILLQLGVAEAEWIELPSPFPVSRRPIYIYRDRHLPLRMDYRTAKRNPEVQEEWLYQIDQWLNARADRKGIIFTVSYRLQEWILAHSNRRMCMIAPDRAAALPKAVEAFRRAGPGAILVSPAIATGFDFQYDAAEYAIIAKMPFPDTRSPLMQARLKANKDYRNVLTMRTLVQACGRIVRAADDRGEVLVADEHAIWFVKYHHHLAPRSFIEAVRIVDKLPVPPPPLNRNRR